MKRNGLILLLVALLVLPVMSMAITSCGGKEVKKVGLTDEEKARLEAERRAREEAERKRQEELARAAAARDAFLNEMVYFDFDRYNIRPDAEQVLRFKGDYMTMNGNILVEVQGHCDERGTEAYNMALGDRRANAARNFLESLGIVGSRLTTVSYGEERPIDPGHDEEAWAKNRRAQFVIIGE